MVGWSVSATNQHQWTSSKLTSVLHMTCDPERGRREEAGGPPKLHLWRVFIISTNAWECFYFLFCNDLLFDVLHDIRSFLICAVFIFLGCLLALILAMREGNNKLCHEVAGLAVFFLFLNAWLSASSLSLHEVAFITCLRTYEKKQTKKKQKKNHDKQRLEFHSWKTCPSIWALELMKINSNGASNAATKGGWCVIKLQRHHLFRVDSIVLY